MHSGNVKALVLGTQGSTYAIQEQSALAWIEERLLQMQASGEIARLQERLKAKGLESVEHPRAVQGLRHTDTPRTFEKDLTVVVSQDLKDAKGRIIQAAGTRLNPLRQVFSKKSLLFLDGDDAKQLDWALQEYKRSHGLVKLVLVKGPVLQLMRDHEIPFYFDQAGRLSRYFGLEQIPARVSQRKDKLLIEELKL